MMNVIIVGMFWATTLIMLSLTLASEVVFQRMRPSVFFPETCVFPASRERFPSKHATTKAKSAVRPDAELI